VSKWGRRHKTYKGGTKTRTERHAHEVVAVDAPHLRIVPEELWNAVQARCARVRTNVGAASGGRPAVYLLSGTLRCGTCGGPLTVINGRASYEPIKVYA
jgi:site-specific DNA recombinase